ncbi:MAG: type II toxin-antitoxin system ParD family antitoxin [Acidobacteria bacterium]|nr:type II toxin-antitoxin system ParD family antitoxin [Acidobacteriota bacterium]
MNVNLTPQLERLVQKRVESGLYNSASEVVREALRLLERHEKIRAAQLSNLRKRIDEGQASLDRGEGVDGEKFMAQLISGLGSKRARRKAR